MQNLPHMCQREKERNSILEWEGSYPNQNSNPLKIVECYFKKLKRLKKLKK